MIGALFRFFLFVGSEWVIWILLGCSLLAMTVFLERWRNLRGQERVGAGLWHTQIESWMKNGVPVDWAKSAEELARRFPCVESRMLLALSKRESYSSDDLEQVVHAVSSSERLGLERYLAVLGTLGNAAPFIGLFGTVLGIIRAFAELGNASSNSGLSSVSGGLAEALVTTAAGLLVALPSVISYNFFQRKIKTVHARTQSMASLIVGRGR